MGCCSRTVKTKPPVPAALPAGLVLPVRIIVGITLLANIAYTLSAFNTLRLSWTLVLILHLVVSANLLSECRRSLAGRSRRPAMDNSNDASLPEKN